MMGGGIAVESKKGQGSTFTLTVRLKASDRKEEQPQAQAAGEQLDGVVQSVSDVETQLGEKMTELEKEIEENQPEKSTLGDAVANAIGEVFLLWLIQQSLSSVESAGSEVIKDIIHRLRKTIAALLVERTQVIKFTKEQRQQAHDDSVRLMQRAIDYIRTHQDDILTALGPEHEDIFKKSPLYVAPATDSIDTTDQGRVCHATEENQFENNRRTSGMFVTPFLN